MPTLEEFAQAEVDRLEALDTDARAELSAAQADLGACKVASADALHDLREADLELAAIRKQLGGSEVSANASAGSSELHLALVAQREARAAVHEARLLQLAGEDRLAQAKSEIEAIGEGLREARASLIESSERSQTLADRADALGSGTALAGLPADASALLADPLFSAAKAKVAATLPGELRTRASQRIAALIDEDEAQAEHVVALERAFDGVFTATGGTSGSVPAASRLLDHTEAALAEYVAQAAGWLADAKLRLDRIAARRTITSAEADALAVDVARTAALAAELAHDQAASDLASAQRLLAERKAELWAADPDPDFASDTEIGDQLAAIDAANLALTMPGTTAADMVAWQAEVPEFAWDDLLDLQLAEHQLTKLAAVVPSHLADTARAAELALVSALQAELDVDRRLEPIDTLLEAGDQTLARLRATLEDRRRAAIRGLR